MIRWLAFLVVLLTSLGVWAGKAPVRPNQEVFVADYASLLQPETKASLVQRVRNQNRRSTSQLFVITVSHLRPYEQSDIVSAAQDCFPAWGMSEADVLLLLSVGDRKARIQLGGQWSNRWDLEMQRIMSEVIVPNCKSGDYQKALIDGAERLLIVTEAGPTASLPAQTWYQALENVGLRLSAFSGLPWPISLGFLGCGGLMLLLSCLPMKAEERLFSLSFGLIALLSGLFASALVSAFWIVVGLGVLWVTGKLIQANFESGAGLGSGYGASSYSSSDDSYSSNTFSYASSSDSSSSFSWSDSSSSHSSHDHHHGGGATGSW